MPTITIYNRSSYGITVHAGQATNAGQFSGTPTTKDLQRREKTNFYPTGGTFRVTAAPVTLGGVAGANWWNAVNAGTPAGIDLYVKDRVNTLRIDLQP